MKIAIGTAQLGMQYGISNRLGQTSRAEAKEIFELARRHGISMVDTASLYGESEAVLGEILGEDFRIVTKTPHLSRAATLKEMKQTMRDAFADSLKKMKRTNAYGLMFHDAADLLRAGGNEVYQIAVEYKQAGLVEKIGVSVYEPSQIDALLVERIPIDVIQIPLNLLDQRFLQNGRLTQLKSRQVEIHARSVFLQGLLLMPTQTIPQYFKEVLPTLNKYQRMLEESGDTLLSGAIGFVKQISEVDYLVVGVNSAQQLLEIVDAYNRTEGAYNYKEYACWNDSIIDPSNWPAFR